MSDNENKLEHKKQMNNQEIENLKSKIADISYWYHKIELGNGIVTPGWSPLDPKRYSIPDDLAGLRVLDIGTWDGYWAFEALKRGAKEVVAIDDFTDTVGADVDRKDKWKTFDICREALGFTIRDPDAPGGVNWTRYNDKDQKLTRLDMSVYDIDNENLALGKFDVVFFFGTIYHLKHPLLALEKISKVCSGSIYVETASLDEYSPFRGGVGQGYNNNENVMEFYPSKEYAHNDSNWWAPTLQCLGSMLSSVGFKQVDCWPLVEDPKELAECRGFASGTKDPEIMPVSRPADVETQKPYNQLKVAAVMSVPRLGFSDNMTCAAEVLFPLRIPLINVQGAFWGQCLERGMQQIIDAGVDIIVTIDYDTVFKKDDLENLLKIIYENDDISAVVPIQRGRGDFPVLMSMKTISGQPRSQVPLTELREKDTTEIATGHFGLTAFRVKDLLDIPHPWFWGQPNSDGMWGSGKIDDDIYFWKQMEKYKKKIVLANRIVVGHLELKVNWPGKDLMSIYQIPGDFHDKGKPENTWK